MKKENNAIAVTSIISGVILVVAILALVVYSPASASSKTVVVSGTGTVKAMPDLVSVYFSIETNGTTSILAKDANTKIYDNFTNSLISAGVNKSKIVTESFSVNPDYVWVNNERKNNGYKAVHTISVKMNANETDKLSNVVDAGVNSGAYVNYINFELSPDAQNKYKALAMEKAAGDAKLKAESVAQGFNKKLGKLVSVNVNNYNYYPVRVYSAGATTEKANVDSAISNMQPGEQDVSASVSATYKLG